MRPDAPAPTPTPARLRVTPALTAKVLVALAVGILLWSLASDLAERAVTAVVVPVLVAGLIGGHGHLGGASRLPGALQGLLAGVALGVVGASVAFGGVAVTALGWLFVLPVLFPAILPRRLRGPLTMRWTDLAAQQPPPEREPTDRS